MLFSGLCMAMTSQSCLMGSSTTLHHCHICEWIYRPTSPNTDSFTHTEHKPSSTASLLHLLCSLDTHQLCVFPEFLQRLVSLSSDSLNMFAVTAALLSDLERMSVTLHVRLPTRCLLYNSSYILLDEADGKWLTHTHLWHTSHEYFTSDRWFLIVTIDCKWPS